MFTDMTQQWLIKLKRFASNVVKQSMSILAILKDINIALISAEESPKKKSKQGYVVIVENLLRLTHRLRIFVVLGSVALLGRIRNFGQLAQSYFANANNAEKNSGEKFLRLKDMAENIAHANVGMKRTDFSTQKKHITPQLHGAIFGTWLRREIGTDVTNAVLLENIYMHIISILEEMAGKIQRIILLRSAPLATERSI